MTDYLFELDDPEAAEFNSLIAGKFRGHYLPKLDYQLPQPELRRGQLRAG